MSADQDRAGQARAQQQRVGQGALSRFGIWTQVVITSVLALTAVLLVNWLAGRPGIRTRWDLTQKNTNTLSTAALGVIDRLQSDIAIDIFYRDEENDLLRGVVRIVHQRTMRLLSTVREWSAGRIDVRVNDPRDGQTVAARLQELRLRGFENCLVLSRTTSDGTLRREVVTYTGDLAALDPGSPDPYRPPSILEYRGERAIVRALLAVTRGDTLDVRFSTGHGEFELSSTDEGGLDLLHGMLADEGLLVGTWNPAEDGDIPEECRCLSIIAPMAAFDDAALDRIETWVRAGGRLVVAPHPTDELMLRSRLPELMERFGIALQVGLVCQPTMDPNLGKLNIGDISVSAFQVLPDDMHRHPVMDPIRLDRRSFMPLASHPVRVALQPPDGVSLPLYTSSVQSWVDNFPTDWIPNESTETVGQKVDMAVATVFRVSQELVGALEEQPQARIVTLGSSGMFRNQLFAYNEDLLRNVYNWVLDREYRLSISPRDPDVRRIPVERRENLARINQVAWGWLPGLCLGLGLWTAWRRRRGAPRSKRRSG